MQRPRGTPNPACAREQGRGGGQQDIDRAQGAFGDITGAGDSWLALPNRGVGEKEGVCPSHL